MDEFGSTISGEDIAVPEELRSLFNDPDEVRVQPLPCNLPGLKSMAVHFGAGARTVPHGATGTTATRPASARSPRTTP